MYLQIPPSSKIQSEIIDIQGYMTLAVYFHYYIPGSLKIKTKLYTVKLGQIAHLIDRPIDIESLGYATRRLEGDRWLPKSEMPYPGYCRAPGTVKCIKSLCDCKTLFEKWQAYVNRKKTTVIITTNTDQSKLRKK